MRTWLSRVALLVAILAFSALSVRADLSRDDEKKAKALLKGTLYLRMDAPCATGRHPFGVYHRPLIEVSPDSANTDVSNEMNVGWYHADSTDWAVRVNDAVTFDSWEWDGTSVEIEVEGTGESDGRDTVVSLVKINGYADFEAAFNRTFAHSPLQDEHSDWPQEIRSAIAQRKLMPGMNKRQAFYIVGQPQSVEKKQEGGKEVEIWTLRDKGLEFGLFNSTFRGPETGRTLRFEDGKLVLTAGKQPGSQLDLGDGKP